MNELYIHVYRDKSGRPFTESAQVSFIESLQELDDYHDTWTKSGFTYVSTLVKRLPQGAEDGPQYEEIDMMDRLDEFRRLVGEERTDPTMIIASAYPGGKL